MFMGLIVCAEDIRNYDRFNTLKVIISKMILDSPYVCTKFVLIYISQFSDHKQWIKGKSSRQYDMLVGTLLLDNLFVSKMTLDVNTELKLKAT